MRPCAEWEGGNETWRDEMSIWPTGWIVYRMRLGREPEFIALYATEDAARRELELYNGLGPTKLAEVALTGQEWEGLEQRGAELKAERCRMLLESESL